jgi:hypothetical protein
MSAFGSGAPPTISVYSAAKTPLGLDLGNLVTALQAYVAVHVAPVWDCGAILKLTDGPVPGTWGFVFLDDADAPGAAAYHTVEGLPLSKVFVRTILDAKQSLTVAASHELVEMLVDPAANLLAYGAGKVVAYEAADPVEDDADGFELGGFQMSDFVFPSWFEDFRAPGSTQFDYTGKLKAPFTLAPNGYMSVYTSQGWSQVFGSVHKGTAFSREDRRGHRSEYRSR